MTDVSGYPHIDTEPAACTNIGTSVAVCIPTLPRRTKLLGRALRSIAAQTHHDVAVSLAYDTEATGAAATRNRAWQATSAEWVAFLDDDDELLPNHLERLVRHQHDTGADLVYPWFHIVGPQGQNWDHRDPLRQLGTHRDPALLDQGNWIPVTYLVRRQLLEQVGGFPDCELEDWQFLIAAQRAGARFAHLPERTWRWHWHDANTKGRPS